MDKKTVIFIGRSGSGKGTQAGLLSDYLKNHFQNDNVFYSETGECFRNFVSENNYSSSLAKIILDEGKREPDFLAIYLWANNFIKNLDGNKHLIIDGTPRSQKEAEILDSALSFYKRNTDVIDVSIGREEATKRLQKRGRDDDKELSDIENRLNWYDTDVIPAIEYFKKNNNYNYFKINGEQNVDEVHKDIIEAIFA